MLVPDNYYFKMLQYSSVKTSFLYFVRLCLSTAVARLSEQTFDSLRSKRKLKEEEWVGGGGGMRREKNRGLGREGKRPPKSFWYVIVKRIH